MLMHTWHKQPQVHVIQYHNVNAETKWNDQQYSPSQHDGSIELLTPMSNDYCREKLVLEQSDCRM